MKLTYDEQLIYNNVLNAIKAMKPQSFCLDKAFYEKAGIQATPKQRQRIGKYFKEQVTFFSNISFDQSFLGCGKCGCKDTTNKLHYEKH